MGMGGNENSTFSHFQWKEEKQPVSGATSASPGTPAYIDTLDCHSSPAKKCRVFDFNDLCDPEDDQQQSRKVNLNSNGSGRNWEQTMGIGRNGNKTWLNLRLGMGMLISHWKWEGMGLKKTFPLISSNRESKENENRNSKMVTSHVYMPRLLT